MSVVTHLTLQSRVANISLDVRMTNPRTYRLTIAATHDGEKIGVYNTECLITAEMLEQLAQLIHVLHLELRS
jgi:hypothetical protein